MSGAQFERFDCWRDRLISASTRRSRCCLPEACKMCTLARGAVGVRRRDNRVTCRCTSSAAAERIRATSARFERTEQISYHVCT